MQQTFAASTAWVMAHPWGSTHPYVIATNDDSSRTYIVGPEFGDGQVTVTFGRPTSGILELLNPTGGGSELADDLTSTATVLTASTSAATVRGSAAAIAEPTAAEAPAIVDVSRAPVLKTGRGAVVE